MHLLALFSGALLAGSSVVALPADQLILHDANIGGNVPQKLEQPAKKRTLHGRFLHITGQDKSDAVNTATKTDRSIDFHPDSLYKVYSSTAEESACHRGQGPAGVYGAETSECDSPIALVNKTMEWIAAEFSDNIDFVIWTGDSARHDSDEEHPRSRSEVLDLNKFMVHKMFDVFGKHNGDEDDEDPNNDFRIPVIPTFGNNDIMPHNIMTSGPNPWTRGYASVWRQFIPEAQRHQFEQGGWFYVEVIPNKLAVFSLNTMYFFAKNAVVDGCAAHSDPGYHHMEWLRIQLQFMRQRGVKAILIGHVPPNRQEAKTLWDETCWQKYALWLRQYRDVIITSAYGHFNYDHFFFQDFTDINKDTENGFIQYVGDSAESMEDEDDDVHAAISPNYFIELREEWSDLPKPPKGIKNLSEDDCTQLGWFQKLVCVLKKSKKDKKKHKLKRKQKKYLKKMGGEYAERFAASFVSASIVPNLLPTLRVFEYNITGLQFADIDAAVPDPPSVEFDVDQTSSEHVDITKKPPKKYKFIVPEPPSKTAEPGPAYSPQSLSLIRYTQYFANLTHINNDFLGSTGSGNELDAVKWREGKHKGKKPHDKDHTPNPKKFRYEVQYDTKDDAIYNLTDLTVPSLIDLARRIGQFKPEDYDFSDDDSVDLDKNKGGKKKKKKHGKHKRRKENDPWYAFVSRAYVETKSQDEIRDEFGH